MTRDTFTIGVGSWIMPYIQYWSVNPLEKDHTILDILKTQ